MSRTRAETIRAVLTLAMMVATLRGGAAEAATKLKVMAGRSTAAIPIYVAQEKGYFAEEGLDPEYLEYSSGAKALELLHLGQVHAALVATLPFITAVSRGVNVMAVADGGSYGPKTPQQALIVKADSDIHTLKDLEGKIIAVNGFGTHGDVVLRADVLPRAGLQPGKTVTLVELPWPQMQPALISRAIHAGLAYEPFASRMASQRDFRVLSWLEDTIPPEGYLVSVILMNSKWVAANEDGTRRFVRAYAKGIEVTNSSLDQAYALTSKSIGLSVEDLKRTRPHEFEKDGKIRMETLRKTADRMTHMGVIEKIPDLDQAVWRGAR